VKKEADNDRRTSKDIISAIELGSKREAKLGALCLILEFGDVAKKAKAKRELHALAYGKDGDNDEGDEMSQASETSTESSDVSDD